MLFLLTSQAKCVIHDEWNTMVVCNLRQFRERRNVVFGVPDALDVDCFRLIINGRRKCFRVVARYELHSNIEALEEYC